jgi:TonB family protein
MLKRWLVAGTMAVLLLAPVRAHADNALAEVREMYASAAYEDALRTLNSVSGHGDSRDERRGLAMYRALCLVALGRSGEAEAAMQRLVQEDPFYRPPADDMPPRVLAVFTAVRARLLPSILETTYRDAKAMFDRKEYEAAAGAFQQVLDGISDPDIRPAAGQAPLSDMRTLAAGFHDLSARAAAPPPVIPVAPAPALQLVVPVAVAQTGPPHIYEAREPRVVAPVAISQNLPRYVGRTTSTRVGTLEIVVGESGAVEAVSMAVPTTDQQFDAMVLSEARKWQYRPATVGGTPVKFRKRIQITLNPS